MHNDTGQNSRFSYSDCDYAGTVLRVFPRREQTGSSPSGSQDAAAVKPTDSETEQRLPDAGECSDSIPATAKSDTAIATYQTAECRQAAVAGRFGEQSGLIGPRRPERYPADGSGIRLDIERRSTDGSPARTSSNPNDSIEQYEKRSGLRDEGAHVG